MIIVIKLINILLRQNYVQVIPHTHTHTYQKKPSSPQGGCEKREALKAEVRGIKRDLTVAKVES